VSYDHIDQAPNEKELSDCRWERGSLRVKLF
jgi:hypothetical protein